MPTALPKRLTSYFFLLVNTITWGSALIIVKPSLEFTTPFRFLFYRFILAAILSLPILLYYWPKVRQKMSAIRSILTVELFGTIGALGLLYLGLARTSALEASFLSTTTPIFVVLAGFFYLKEKVEKREVLGLLIAFSGTIALTLLPVFLNGSLPQEWSIIGNTLIIFQNIATAIGMILAKKYYKNIPKLFATSIGFYVGILAFGFLSFAELGFSSQSFVAAFLSDIQHSSVLIAVGYMAVFGSIIGLTAYIKGQDGIEASEASLFWYLQPLVFVPLSFVLLQEAVHPMQIVSMAIVLLGVYIAEKRVKK